MAEEAALRLSRKSNEPEPVPARALRERILGIAASASGVSAFLPPTLQPAPRGRASAPPPGTWWPRGGAPAALPFAGAATGRPFAGEASIVAGRVLELANDPEGCRQVQRALEAALDDESRERIALELKGNVAEAARSPYANFVIQKCVTTLPPHAFSFIFEELMAEQVLTFAKHKFACRVLQRLMEQGVRPQVDRLLEALLGHVVELSRHPYGNYVVQHMLAQGSPEQRASVTEAVTAEAAALCRDTFGSNVVRAALAAAPVCAASRRLARKIASDMSLIGDVASARQGHTTIRLVVEALDIPERRALAHDLEQCASLANSRYGRAIFHAVGLSLPKRTGAGQPADRGHSEQSAVMGGA